MSRPRGGRRRRPKNNHDPRTRPHYLRERLRRPSALGIGRPQKAFLDLADHITGSVLDAGCGTGENALFIASRGHKVTGIDFLAEPIARARRKAIERGLLATFIVMGALALKDLPEVFGYGRSLTEMLK